MTGAQRILAERIRQIQEEGFGSNHDDEYHDGQLAKAADNYLIYATRQIAGYEPLGAGLPTEKFPAGFYGWPWDYQWWKPSDDPVRNLVRAGALIAAEIDRIERTQERGDCAHD